MKNKLLYKGLSIIASLSLFVNSLIMPLSISAQEVTPAPVVEEETAEAELAPVLEATPIPIDEPEAEPTIEATPIPIDEPEAEPTIEASPTPETNVEDGTVEVLEAETVSENILEETIDTELPEIDLEAPLEDSSATLIPSISTDKSDYAPSETVVLSGKDFPVNSDLQIKVTWPDGIIRSSAGVENETDEVLTNDTGAFVFLYDLRGEGQEGEYLVEIIMGTTVLSSTTFTDSPDKVTICHAAGQLGTTHFITLTLPYNAVYGNAGHFYENGTPRAGHEDDYLGPCNVPPPPDPDPPVCEESVPLSSPLDYIDLGDVSSETAHSAVGWGADPGGGNYGGRDGGETFSLVVGPNECTDDGRVASFILDAGTNYANKINIRHLDGMSNLDSFDVYINGSLLAHYADQQDAQEIWYTTEFNLPNLTGLITVEIFLTDPIWGSCSTWGQLAINWVEITGYECPPEPEPGSIQGRKYYDVNANGDFDQEEKDEAGDPNRLNDWTIYLYSDLNDSPITSLTTGHTGNKGQYRFENLTPGTYYVCEDLKEGWVQTEPASGPEKDGAKCHTVEVGDGQDVKGIQFGNIRNPVKIKAAKVICDSEDLLPNWGNHGSVIDENTAQNYVNSTPGCHLEEDWQFQWAGAGAGTFGAFQTDTSLLGGPWNTFNAGDTVEIFDISNLGGRIETREVFPNNDYFPFSNDGDESAEFYCTGDVFNYDNWEWINNPQYGQTYYCVGFNALNTGSITIEKDVVPDDSSTWNIKVSGPDNFGANILIGDGGSVKLSNRVAGTYSILEILQAGYHVSDFDCDASDWDIIEEGAATVDLKPGEDVTCRVTNTRDTSDIYGRKWNDINGNHIWDEGEFTLGGWTIVLYENNDGVPGIEVARTETETTGQSMGHYSFQNIPTGTYHVCEEPKPGWEQTYPYPEVCHQITLEGNDSAIREVDFGNRQRSYDVSIEKSNDRSGGAAVNDTVTYTLSVTNNGNQPLFNIAVSDALPGGFDYVSSSAEIDGIPKEPTISSGLLSWNIPVLAPEDSVTIIYQATIASDVDPGVYTNLATCKASIGRLVTFIGRPVLVLQPENEESETIDCNIADSSVPIGAGFTFSDSLGGQVLGLATELPATGNKTEVLLILLATLVLGGVLKISGYLSRKDKVKMIKKITGLIVFLFSLTATNIQAFADTVRISELPEYIRHDNFNLSYSALSENPITAQFYFRKEGDSYASFGPALLGASGQIQVTGAQVNEQVKYYFKVEINGGVSDETTVLYDHSGPSPVQNYWKEVIGGGSYKLHWKNPGDSDFSRVFIYRSDNKDFTADPSTKVGELGGAPDQEMTWDNFGMDPNKTYYYALRAIDKAGNTSSVVADPEVTETIIEETVVEGGTSEEVVYLPSEETDGQVLGEEEEEVSEADVMEITQEVFDEAVTTLTGTTWGKVASISALFAGFVLFFIARRKK